MDWKNHLEKNPIILKKNSKKTVKNKVKLTHVKKQPIARKRIFVQTPFSHSALKLELKKFHGAKALGFSLHFLLRRDQNHFSNLTSKILKCVNRSLKKDSAPIQFNFFEL